MPAKFTPGPQRSTDEIIADLQAKVDVYALALCNIANTKQGRIPTADDAIDMRLLAEVALHRFGVIKYPFEHDSPNHD